MHYLSAVNEAGRGGPAPILDGMELQGCVGGGHLLRPLKVCLVVDDQEVGRRQLVLLQPAWPNVSKNYPIPTPSDIEMITLV